jgi:hypothetical protein
MAAQYDDNDYEGNVDVDIAVTGTDTLEVWLQI